MLSLFSLLVIYSSGSLFASAYFHKKFEESIPLTVFSSVLIVFLTGLFDQLRFGVYILCLVSAVLYGLGIYRMVTRKNYREVLSDFFTPAFGIFLVLLVAYAFCIIGRVAYDGDEFSFWASSVKKMWYLNAFHCVPAAEPYFTEYPPGMQIFEYFFLAITGKFSEWRINFAYMFYIFVLFLPFLKGLRWKTGFLNVLICAVIFSCGTIIYPEALNNLQVDFALGATFAFGMALMASPLSKDFHFDKFTVMNIILAMNMLILIKSAGKLFASILMVSLVISVCWSLKGTLFQTVRLQKKWCVLFLCGCASPFLTAALWKAKYTYYSSSIAFDTGNYNLSEFILILLGKADGGYRAGIKSSFLGFLTSEKLTIGPLTITNLQLTILLGVIICLICRSYQKKDVHLNGVAPFMLFAFLPIYWLGLLASYMYTFSEREGIILASMQRYLNIYFTGIVLFFVLLAIKRISFLHCNGYSAMALLLSILCMVSVPNIVSLLSRSVVESSQSERAPYQSLADQIIADKGDTSEEKQTVLLIMRAGYPHIPVNHFTYLLWPSYIVPWECSYGSHGLFDGDQYTKIYTAEEFLEHIHSLSVDYIAIGHVDDDFISMYSSLFNTPLQDGQVYRVYEGQKCFELLTA